MKKIIMLIMLISITLFAQKIPYPMGSVIVELDNTTSYQLNELQKEYKNVYCDIRFGIYDLYKDKEYFIDNKNINKTSIKNNTNSYIINIKSEQVKNLIFAYVSQAQDLGCDKIILTSVNVIDYKNDFNLTIYDINDLFEYIVKVSALYKVSIFLDSDEFNSKGMKKLSKLLPINKKAYLNTNNLEKIVSGFYPYLF